jgi:hypothetical protein
MHVLFRERKLSMLNCGQRLRLRDGSCEVMHDGIRVTVHIVLIIDIDCKLAVLSRWHSKRDAEWRGVALACPELI